MHITIYTSKQIRLIRSTGKENERPGLILFSLLSMGTNAIVCKDPKWVGVAGVDKRAIFSKLVIWKKLHFGFGLVVVEIFPVVHCCKLFRVHYDLAWMSLNTNMLQATHVIYSY